MKLTGKNSLKELLTIQEDRLDVIKELMNTCKYENYHVLSIADTKTDKLEICFYNLSGKNSLSLKEYCVFDIKDDGYDLSNVRHEETPGKIDNTVKLFASLYEEPRMKDAIEYLQNKQIIMKDFFDSQVKNRYFNKKQELKDAFLQVCLCYSSEPRFNNCNYSNVIDLYLNKDFYYKDFLWSLDLSNISDIPNRAKLYNQLFFKNLNDKDLEYIINNYVMAEKLDISVYKSGGNPNDCFSKSNTTLKEEKTKIFDYIDSYIIKDKKGLE